MRPGLLAFGGLTLALTTGCQATTGAAVPPLSPGVGTTLDHDDVDDLVHPDEISGAREAILRPGPGPFGAPTPVLHVRMHAIAVANDDGSEQVPTTAAGVVKAIQATNTYYRAAGIFFEFDPAADFEVRRSTLLNNDCTFARGSLTGPKTAKPTCDKRPNEAERTLVALGFPDRLVVLFRSHNGATKFDDVSATWVPLPATGGYSSSNMAFVVVGPGPGGGTFLAHEVGHYLHIGHTFRTSPANVEVAATAIRRHVEVGRHPVEEGLGCFDGDAPLVLDTPPDPNTGIFRSQGLDPCGATDAIPVPVRFSDGTVRTYALAPDRHNIMSYFKGCSFYHDFSPQQIQRMRDALLNGNRRNVLEAQR